MSILSELSSRRGERNEEANHRVAEKCLAAPELIEEMAEALGGVDERLLGDCGEVLTLVAERRPDLVAPLAARMAPLLSHPATRVRWEITHAFALIAPYAPEAVAGQLNLIARIVAGDSSLIVRDYAVDLLSGYARSGKEAARAAYPYLREALRQWDGKHAGHALNGLGNVLVLAPELTPEILTLAQSFLADPRKTVSQAAKLLITVAGK